MANERERIDAFLGSRRIALVGASRNDADFSRAVLDALVSRGIDVVPVHPDAGEIAGRKAYASVREVPGTVHGALLMTPPAASADVVRQCADAGIRRVWLHRGAGEGAVSEEAVRTAEARGLDAVVGRCPLMFLGDPPAQPHRTHAALLKLAGTYPWRPGEGLGAAPRAALTAAAVTALAAAALLAWWLALGG